MVKDSEELTELFERNEPARICGLLEAAAPGPAKDFKASLDVFLSDYGYRSVFEAEMMLPNWESDPSYVFAMIRNYLGADPASSPSEPREEAGGGRGTPRWSRRWRG